MSPAAILICSTAVGEYNKFFSFTGMGDPYFQPFDGSAAGASEGVSRPFSSTANIDSSLTLVAVVVVTGILCVLLRVLLRRFACASSRAADPSLAHPNRKEGLDPSAVATLPLVAYGTAAEHWGNDDCSICLSEFEEGETVKLIPHCGHVFHAACVDTWLSTHVTCPLCRSAAQLFNVAVQV